LKELTKKEQNFKKEQNSTLSLIKQKKRKKTISTGNKGQYFFQKYLSLSSTLKKIVP
tara:strand:+ start:127 stop:297 length:171 start_codon:yes stop_codon:yes gene_type:complete